MRSEEDCQIRRIREALTSDVCDDDELKEFEICETDLSICWRLLLRILQGGTVVCLYGESCARWVCPRRMIEGNGSQFKCGELDAFCGETGIDLECSTPRLNGEVGRMDELMRKSFSDELRQGLERIARCCTVIFVYASDHSALRGWRVTREIDVGSPSEKQDTDGPAYGSRW